jgi:Bacterial pre-peptidase C-terminal domain
MSRKTQTRRANLSVTALEDRVNMSWGGVPPALAFPTNAVRLTLDAQAQAQAPAAITANEVDFYRFTAPTTGNYHIGAATPTSSLDTVLAVYNWNGQRIAYNDDISANNSDSQVTVSLTAGQTYFVGITNYTGSPNGGYSWFIAGPAGGARDDAYEDNDTMARATDLGRLTARRTVTNLVMADAADWFRFTTTATGGAANYVRIAFSHAQGDLDLRLFNAQGQQVRLSDGSGNEERISLNGLAAGTYYVQVYGYRGATNPSYSLEVNPPTSGGLKAFDAGSLVRDLHAREPIWVG